jgi:exosome complex component RRP41
MSNIFNNPTDTTDNPMTGDSTYGTTNGATYGTSTSINNTSNNNNNKNNRNRLRIDGRKPLELRRFITKIGQYDSDGSCELQMGNTIILCIINGPQEGTGLTIISKEKFYSKLLENVFKELIFTTSKIEIHLQVLQSDGGLLGCMLNCCCLALVDAGIPLKDYICATTSNSELLDLNSFEEHSVLTMGVLKKSGKIILLNMEQKFIIDDFITSIQVLKEGCLKIGELMDKAIMDQIHS